MRAALDHLCRDYWPPLYNFVRRRGHGSQDAQDLVQGFFASLLENQAYRRADPAKGKFRTFLLGALKHYLADERDRQRTLKRGGGHRFVWLNDESVAVEENYARDLATQPTCDEERLFERRWALTVVARTLESLQAQFAGNEQKAPAFAALAPFLTGGAALPDAEGTARTLGISPENLRNQVARLRKRFREGLREEIARTVASEEDLGQEMRYLLRVLLAST